MNILFMAQDVTPSGRTGDAVHVRELAWNLAELGNRVFLVGRELQEVSEKEYLEYQEVLDKFRKNENIELSLMKTGYKLSFSIIKDFIALRNAMRVLKENKIDVIYSRSFDCKLEAFLSKLFGIPLVLEINGVVDEELEQIRGRKAGSVRRKILLFIRKALFRAPDRFVSVTQSLKDMLMSDYRISGDRISVISNGVNEKMFKPMDRNDARKKLGFKPQNTMVCFVGNLMPWQGLEYLVKASVLIAGKYRESRFLIVGGGIYKQELQKVIEKNEVSEFFIFSGSVPQEEVPEYINSSDVCVVLCGQDTPQHHYMKFFEYLSCGKSVVASDIPGISEIISEHNCGILVEPENIPQIADAIMRLIGDDELRKQMGENGRKYILSGHTWKDVAMRVDKVLKEAAGK